MFRGLGLIFITWIGLTSCTPSLPPIKEEALPLPGSFSESPSQIQAPTTASMLWRDFFSDSTLSSLIEYGLKNNQELRIFEQEIAISKNEVSAREGEYLPKVSVGGSYSFQKSGDYTSEGFGDAANQVPNHLQIGSLGFATTWEIDIWGKLRNASKSAYMKYLSTVEGKNFLVTHLVSEVAIVYFELLALDKQLDVVASYIEVLKKLQVMMAYIQNAGRTTSLSVKRFEAEVLKNQSRQIQLQQKILVTENNLNTLIGRYPQLIDRKGKNISEMAIVKMATGTPISLLDYRPDVKAATLDLESTKLNVSSVKAQFYPSLSLDGGTGFESFNSKHFLESPGSLFYGLVGKLTAPVLNRKAIKAAYFSANSKQIQAIVRYEQTLLKAFTEVVNQWNSLKNLDQVFDLKSKQVAALSESVRISNLLFQAARVDYIESLFTQRDALEAQMELIEIKNQQLKASVSLYKALGGGWKEAFSEK